MSAVDDILAKKKAELERSVPGATVLTPKAQMLDARDVQAKNPDKAVRWVNIKDPQKAASRQLEGYVRLSEEEGGRALGDELALFGAPREHVEEMREAIRQVNHERLNAHVNEMEGVAENVAKIMRDRYGIRVDAKQILINDKE